MTDDIKGLRDDIAFMRALAEGGRASPSQDASILVAAGVTFGLASLGQWTMATGLVRESPLGYSLVWVSATVIFMIVLVAVKSRLNKTPGARPASNRAMGMAWAAVGWGIFTLAGALSLVCWRAHSTVPLMLVPSIILILYGVAWSVAAAATGRRWIWLTAIGSYLGALATAATSDQPVVYLVYAAALALLAALPGLVLMRQAPASVV
jgi:hypothetical protein